MDCRSLKIALKRFIWSKCKSDEWWINENIHIIWRNGDVCLNEWVNEHLMEMAFIIHFCYLAFVLFSFSLQINIAKRCDPIRFHCSKRKYRANANASICISEEHSRCIALIWNSLECLSMWITLIHTSARARSIACLTFRVTNQREILENHLLPGFSSFLLFVWTSRSISLSLSLDPLSLSYSSWLASIARYLFSPVIFTISAIDTYIVAHAPEYTAYGMCSMVVFSHIQSY